MTSGVGARYLRELEEVAPRIVRVLEETASMPRDARPLTREDIDRAIEEAMKKTEDANAQYEAKMQGKSPSRRY